MDTYLDVLVLGLERPPRPQRRRHAASIVCIDMRMDMCRDVCVDMCSDTCSDICMDMCTDCVWTHVQRPLSTSNGGHTHVYRHVHKHASRHANTFCKCSAARIRAVCAVRLNHALQLRGRLALMGL